MSFDQRLSDAEWLNRLREAESRLIAGRIGPYELISEVTRGGQGVVFRAIQPGANRSVALKRLIGGGFAKPAARARFEREIEAVCALNHANIVTVYGVESIDGQPVLAMEWIDGEPLDAWARDPHRSTRDALRVLLQVCDAIQHAHQHGVMHRDLKPSNILVTRDGSPRVLDFGLARAIDADDSAANRLTGGSELLGTPAYASPEQVGLHRVPIDLRTDVYSLGAILYQLLCGRTPHDPSLGLPALLEAIRSVDPPAPSTVRGGIERDLAAIALKALAKDPARRYQSVDALSADLRRYLDGQPVLAHPPSLGYQLGKLVRRYRLPFGLVSLLFALLTAFGITATSLAFRLDRQREAALAAREGEADARAAAEQVSEFLRRMLAAAHPLRAQGEEITVNQIVDEALRQADAMFERAESDAPGKNVEAAIRLTLGETLYGLGRYPEAQQQLERARALFSEQHGSLHPETAWALLHLGHVALEQGAFDDAISRYHEAEQAYRSLPGMQMRLAATLASLAAAHMHRGDLPAAEGLLVEAEALRADHPEADDRHLVNGTLLLASLKSMRGELAEAERLLVEALERARRNLGDRHELTIAILSNLAVTLKQQGRPAEARPYSEECLATARRVFGEGHSRTLLAQANLASLLQALKLPSEAESHYEQLMAHFREQEQLDDPTALAVANNLASLLLEQGRAAEAESLLRETLERAQRVHGPRHPNTAMIMGQLARAMTAANPQAAAEARPLLIEALAIFEATLPPEHPHIQKTRDELSRLEDR